MAMRILFPVNKLMNMGTPRKDFFMSGPSGNLSGPKRASYRSKKIPYLDRIELQVIFYNSTWVPASFELSRIGL